MDKLDYYKNASYHLKNSSCFLGADEWKAKLESAYSFMLKYPKITVCLVYIRLWNDLDDFKMERLSYKSGWLI